MHVIFERTLIKFFPLFCISSQMTSVERIVEYCKLEAEPPEKTDVEPPKEWPDRGSIYFKDMSFRYAAALPNVLHHITCKIHRKEKVKLVVMYNM